MLSLLDRIQDVEDNLTLKDNYNNELEYLMVIEQEIPVYRRLGTPVWKAEEAKARIKHIRGWIDQELSSTL
jgi:hypothetical protein